MEDHKKTSIHQNPLIKPRILFIADVPGWIFHRHIQTLRQHLSDEFEIGIAFRHDDYHEDDYDLIYPMEFDMVNLDRIHNKSKYVTGIRSYISWSGLDFLPFIKSLQEHYNFIHVVSQSLFSIFDPFIPHLRYVTHGIDTRLFTPSRPSTRNHKIPRIGWAGNTASLTKGFSTIIEPLMEMPGVEFVYSGFKENNRPPESMPAFYESIDIYICASSSEGNSNTLLEAAAMEKAIITTNTGTVPEYLIHDHSALIVDRDFNAFKTAVGKIRDNSDLRIRLGKNARQAVIQGGWDWETKSKEYRSFFREAVHSLSQTIPSPAIPQPSADSEVSLLAGIYREQWQLERELHQELAVRVYNQTFGKDLLASLEEKSAWIKELENVRATLQDALEKKDAWIGELETCRNSLQEMVTQKDAWIKQVENYRDTLQETLARKETWITELENYRDTLQDILAKKDAWISELETYRDNAREMIDKLEAYRDLLVAKQIEFESREVELISIKSSLSYRLVQYIRGTALSPILFKFLKFLRSSKSRLTGIINFFRHTEPMPPSQTVEPSIPTPLASNADMNCPDNGMIAEGRRPFGGDNPAPGPFTEKKRDPFSALDIDWLDRVSKIPKPLSVAHPDWLGIKSSAQELFDNIYLLDDNLDSAKGDYYARLFSESQCQSIVIQGFPLSYGFLVSSLHQIAPQIPVYVVWHGGFVQTDEDYGWKSFTCIENLWREGKVKKIGFVKKGMAEVMEKAGYRTGFIMNMVRAIPDSPSVPQEKGPHLGIWGSWRKRPFVMLAAAKLFGECQPHVFWGSNDRVIDFSRDLGLTAEINSEMIERSLVMEEMKKMHLNLNVSLHECAPMLPLESLSIGVPCLLGPHSHYFEDDQYLYSRLVVPAPDRADIIAKHIEITLQERQEIIASYRTYAPAYNRRAREFLAHFLEIKENDL